MKQSFIYSLLFCTLLGLGFSSCRKADFDENYYNPEGAVGASVGSLYAGMFNNGRILPRYWNLYTYQIPILGTYTQASGYSNGQRIYEQAVNYTQDRWNDYFTEVVARYREVEKAYNNLPSEADKQGYLLFLETARIFYYDQTAQMVDLWGDIPFTAAGQLNATGTLTLPKYDKGKDIYAFILTDLKRISDYLASAAPEAFYANQLTKFDLLNGGSTMQWRKYANSLRLRLAMRTSYSDEAGSRAIAQEILGNANRYPLVETVAENIQMKVTGSLERANDVREGFNVNPYASSYMVDTIMNPSGDPRLPVYFTTNRNGGYRGVPNTWTAADVSTAITAGEFSRYDSVTFTENNRFPGIILTASEVDFLRSEAFERWGGGDARTAYENGIRKSIQYYYSINNSSSVARPEPMPTEARISAYLQHALVAYGTDRQRNLEKIATQKWVDFNVMQAQHAWAELRRTKMPRLLFPTDPSSNIAPNVPSRLLYPSSERTLNAVNYEAVKGDDTGNKKVFWDVR